MSLSDSLQIDTTTPKGLGLLAMRAMPSSPLSTIVSDQSHSSTVTGTSSVFTFSPPSVNNNYSGASGSASTGSGDKKSRMPSHLRPPGIITNEATNNVNTLMKNLYGTGGGAGGITGPSPSTRAMLHVMGKRTKERGKEGEEEDTRDSTQ